MWRRRFVSALLGSAAVVLTAVVSAPLEPALSRPRPATTPRNPWPLPPPGLRAEVTPGQALVRHPLGGWQVWEEDFGFTITVFNPDERPLFPHGTLYVRVTRFMEITGYVGDDWSCGGGPHMWQCDHPAPFAPNEPWPPLEFTARQLPGAKGQSDVIHTDVRWPGEVSAEMPIRYGGAVE